MMSKTIYTAGPISGHNGNDVLDYFQGTKKKLEEAGFKVLQPMQGKEAMRTEIEFRAEGYKDIKITSNHAIYTRDQWMVRQSDIIYVNLMNSGERVSIGSMMEMAWASILGKYVIASIPKENVHRHAFVLEAASVVFDSHEEAMDYLTKHV